MKKIIQAMVRNLSSNRYKNNAKRASTSKKHCYVKLAGQADVQAILLGYWVCVPFPLYVDVSHSRWQRVLILDFLQELSKIII